jgi:uncharacterized protein
MHPRQRYLHLLAAGLVTISFIFAATSWFFAVKFTSRMPRAAGSFAEWLPPTTESVRFHATDGIALSAWFVPRDGATRAVVLLHGHQSHRRQMLARAKFLHDQGHAVLLYDARAHGESDGAHITVGWHETRDLLGALDYLRGRGLHEFGLIGVSQGGATIALAARELREVKWVVLESVYPTLRDALDCRFRRFFMMPGWLGASLMMPFAQWRLGISVDDVAPIEHVAALPCPVLIAHGERDRNTLVRSAHELFARTNRLKSLWVVPGAAHVDLYGFAKRDYEHHLLEFIARATGDAALAARE